MASDIRQSDLNLTPEEKRVYGQLFRQADTENLGVVTGDVAVKFFEKTRLDASVLGEIWQIADIENRGLLTPAGFSVALRLIGHCQAGRDASPANIKRPGPLPRFEGIGSPIQTPSSPVRSNLTTSSPVGAIRVPPLPPDKVAEYSSLFERAGARNGYLSGDVAKQVFEKARLPNEVLGRIWNLSDTQHRGALSVPEFVIAMHLLTSLKNGSLRSLPQSLPPGLFEAASRRGSVPQAAGILRQATGPQEVQRTQSPLAKPVIGLSHVNQSEGEDWLVSSTDKARFDQMFASIDTANNGYMTGEQAVSFFSNSGLSEDALAQIWDLADINSEGQLNRDEFAVAMYLIRQQRNRKDGREDLPQTLPAKLIPPSMRHKSVSPPQPTAPTFDSAAFTPQQSKSAADDLFGLDALTASVPVSPPKQTSVASAPPNAAVSRNAAAGFKPFVPTSSFGQGIASQTTGTSQSGSTQSRDIPPERQPAPPAATDDDLLGDNDPQVSSKLTAETTELGNMSNQVATLRNQMQEVQSKKAVIQGDLSNNSTQKRDLEARLAHFRTQYEQEIREVKSLEEQLNNSRADTRKTQQELAMVEGAYQDLQTKRKEISTALEADQQENNTLKERIRAMNAEITELQPQLDKLRSEARQLKGLVAINKKQLSTSEGERDKLESERVELERSNTEATAGTQPVVQQESTPPAASPSSASGQSTNPFFRHTSQTSIERTMSPSIFTQELGTSRTERQTAFDSFFGPGAGASNESHRIATPPAVEDVTPTPSPPSGSRDVSTPYAEPPAAPESRQITSSALPLRTNMLRTDSIGSSVKANPPASRGMPSPNATPVRFASSPAGSLNGDVYDIPDNTKATSGSTSIFDKAVETATNVENPADSSEYRPPSNLDNVIPGAFPGDTPLTQTPMGEESSAPQDEQGVLSETKISEDINSEPGLATSREVEIKDQPFADKNTSKEAENRHQQNDTTQTSSSIPNPSSFFASAANNRSNTEFPPIQEIQHDSDSDSDNGGGFEDDFNPASPPRVPTKDNVTAEPTKDALNSTNAKPSSINPLSGGAASNVSSELPTPSAQKSPPTYNESVENASEGTHRDANQFAPEFGGLLPSREISHDPPQSSLSPASATGESLPAVVTSESASRAIEHDVAPTSLATKVVDPVDEFDTAFDDLDEAKDADETAVDAFSGHNIEHEFNPVFDSPAPSKAATMDFQQSPPIKQSRTDNAQTNDAFTNFESSLGSSTTALYSTAGTSKPQQSQSPSHDWDAIFSGLDKAPELGQSKGKQDDPFAMDDEVKSNVATVGRNGTNITSANLQRPSVPTRGISSSSVNDDPILKTLTSMGYKRDEALTALEKYDYNIDKAVDYLTFKT